ncbi:MAG: hypothetical protein JWO62_1611 [Acidimicrobiaceae bacterium]|nr:hypothetical protein [Acidimicrobiaceae bacterium]
MTAVFEHLEPRADRLSSWLDLDVPDDRFVASTLLLQSSHPGSRVYVATSDLNLQTKLAAAGLPFIEPPPASPDTVPTVELLLTRHMAETPCSTEEPIGPLRRLLDPDSALPGTGSATVGEFWQWAFSDVLSNATRGAFGEYLVARCLGITSEPRIAWDAVDLRYHGHGIEVKTSSRHQAWPSPKPTPPSFDIAAHRPWDPVTGLTEPVARRVAGLYVFCHYVGPESSATSNLDRRIAVLNAENWEFYVTPTTAIAAIEPARPRLSLSAVMHLAEAPRVAYADLKSTIDGILGFPTSPAAPESQATL